jgi:hypothetical protein
VHARRIQRLVTVLVHGQCTQRDMAVHGLPVAETWNQWQKDGLGSSAIMPLHCNLLKLAWKGVLTGAAVGSVVVLRVEVDKWLRSG